MGTPAPPLVGITVGDEPAAWVSIGFSVADDGACPVGTVSLHLAGPGAGRGVTGWTLADGGGDIDGVPTATADLGSAGNTADLWSAGNTADLRSLPERPPDHPNGVLSIDHLVAMTPDLDRTTAALEARGIALRRTRETGRGRAQRFFRLGEVILELIGPVEPQGDGPAKLWGLAFTAADLDATAGHLQGRIGATKDAVQPGRRIATLHAGDAISVPVAFMSQAHR